MIFIELFTFIKFFYFCPDFFGHVGKKIDKEAKVNFKIHNVPNWNTDDCNKHLAIYPKK